MAKLITETSFNYDVYESKSKNEMKISGIFSSAGESDEFNSSTLYQVLFL